MSRFAMALFACVVASDAALMPSPAEAARLSKAEKVALKQAVTACKAQAKGQESQMAGAPKIRQPLRC
jgi:hypothetical protein